MIIFCFNDCIPPVSKQQFTAELKKTIVEYNKLFENYRDDIAGVLTGQNFGSFRINDENITLQDCVAAIPDRETRSFAYSLFDKHPVEDHLPSVNAEDVLASDYCVTINGTRFSAFHPAITSLAGGVLFTVGIHAELCIHPLEIKNKAEETRAVDNLYGDKANTALMEAKIQQEIAAKKGNLEQLLALTKASCSGKFKKSFENCSSSFQQNIIDHFNKALLRKEGIGLKPDDSLIKATETKGFDFETYELRIFSPAAYRVYFYHDGGTTYLASLEKKPSNKKQNQDINAAASTIAQQFKTGFKK